MRRRRGGLALALLLLAAPAAAEPPRTVTFQASAEDHPNPERGFWRFAADDFAAVTAAELQSIRGAGLTLAYAVVRLDRYRAKDLPPRFLKRLDRSFALARAAGIKVILRFAYNYPDSERDYERAKDAPLARVRRHVAQLAPVAERNRDVIAVLQAGFIGAWGEGHASSNGLDSPAGKRAVVEELLKAVPADLEIQWRYPADLIAWRRQKLADAERVGLHNDCFLSSPTDVGTYAEDKTERETQREAAAAITARRFHSGETCGAEPKAIRGGCAAILEEGRRFHLSALNRDYYEAFFKAWEKQGCFDEVARSLGYRLRLTEAKVTGAAISVSIANDGWARPLVPRRLRLSPEAAESAVLGPYDLTAIGPGETVTFTAALPVTVAKACLGAPDPAPSLAANPQFAIRFANRDDREKGQHWDAASGRFCFRF